MKLYEKNILRREKFEGEYRYSLKAKEYL